MQLHLALFVLVQIAWALPAQAINFAAMRQAIYKIETVSQEPKVGQPWLHHASTESSGTGFYIGDGRILTNAHVVAQAKFLTVTSDGSDKAESARVRFIAHDCDLAILELIHPGSLDDVEPLKFAGLPQLRRPVAVVGYPMGGDQLSITEGVVSRIAYRQYAHDGFHQHLLVQVDSAINPGNSGGPVIQGGGVVGVAFQSFNNAENTGYIIPVPVINRFLLDIEDGTYDGHPDDGILYQENLLNHAATRQFHGLRPTDGGVKVLNILPRGAASGLIQAGDIILNVGGQPVGIDGRIAFQGERIDFKVIFDLRQVGDVVKYAVIRNGRRLNVTVPVKVRPVWVPQQSMFTKHPRFFVYAGLVFSALSRDYFKGWGRNWFRDSPYHLRYFLGYADFLADFRENRDIIVLSSRLPDEVNAYARNSEEKVLSKVNGHLIRSLEELEREMLRPDDPYIVIEFYDNDAPLVFLRAEAREAHQRILSRYGVSPTKNFSGIEDDGATAGNDL